MARRMRKLAAVALSALMCASVFAAASCSFGEEDEAITAYEIAVKNGFEGTEQEWLASLKGNTGEDGADLTVEDLYEAAKLNGFEGTFEEFIRAYMQDMDILLREDNDTQTISKNTSSVVSICAGFQKNIIIRDGWGQVRNKTQVAKAEGSGVIYKIESNGEFTEAYIITNYHVLYGGADYTDNENGLSTDIYVYTYGAREIFNKGDANGDGYLDDGATMGDDGDGIRATYVGGEIDYDIAILKISDNKYLSKCAISEVTFGDSHSVRLGEKAFAIGNSNGHGISVTSGAVSVVSETITMQATDNKNRSVDYRVMRTDAAINAGNSGGGLFNAKGELIGITNAKNIQDKTDNMGYALPSTKVKYVVENILDNVVDGQYGYVTRPWLGIETKVQSSVACLVNGELRIKETFFFNKAGTDGEKNGVGHDKFKHMDILIGMQVGNEPYVAFDCQYQFTDTLLTIRKGDTVVFTVLRENVKTQISITFDKDEYFVRESKA